MKFNIKNQIFYPNHNEYEFCLTYTQSEMEIRKISFFKPESELSNFLIELLILQDFLEQEKYGWDVNTFLNIRNSISNHFKWLDEVERKKTHYFKYKNYDIYYYNEKGEKFNVEVNFSHEILKKIKEVNKKHKISQLRHWASYKIEHYDDYHRDLKQVIMECLALDEKIELEKQISNNQNTKKEIKKRIKV